MTLKNSFYHRYPQPEFDHSCLPGQPGKHIYPQDVFRHWGDIKCIWPREESSNGQGEDHLSHPHRLSFIPINCGKRSLKLFRVTVEQGTFGPSINHG